MTIEVVAAVLAMVAVAAGVNFVFRSHRKAAPRIVPAGHAPVPVADQPAARRITTKSNQPPPQTRLEDREGEFAARLDSGFVPPPSPPTNIGPPGAIAPITFAPLTAKLNDQLKVGVVAINSSTKALTADIEGFDVVERGPS
jgi:hypothetical protein